MKKINVISSVLCLLSIELGIADSKAPPVNQPIENKVNRGYTNMPKDPLTDRVSLGGGYRQFSPILRGFTKHDSASPVGKGGINAYNYVHNNPVNAADPTGHVYEPLEYTITPGFNDTNFSRLGSSTWDVIGEVSDIEQDFEDALDILDMVFGSGIAGAEDFATNYIEKSAAYNDQFSKYFMKDFTPRSIDIARLKTLQILNIEKDNNFFERLLSKGSLKPLLKQSPPELTLALFMKNEEGINFPCCTHSSILQSMYYSGQEYSMAQIAAVISSGRRAEKVIGGHLSGNTTENVSNILDMLSNHTAHSNFHEALEISGPVYSTNEIMVKAFEKYAKLAPDRASDILILNMPHHQTFLYRQAFDDEIIMSDIEYNPSSQSLTEKMLTNITKETQHDDPMSFSGYESLNSDYIKSFSAYSTLQDSSS